MRRRLVLVIAGAGARIAGKVGVMSLFLKFNLILILVFAVALVPAGYISNSLLQKNARTQIVQIARIMLQSALATRGYTNKQIKPLLAPRLADEFLPQSVPSYSATEIFNNLRESNPEYTYKEAALNPTNPRDRTVEWEADVVNSFRAAEKLPEIIGERDAPLGRALYLARPIKITDAGCLSCHTTPDVAPASRREGLRDERRLWLEAERDHRRADHLRTDGRSDRPREHGFQDASRVADRRLREHPRRPERP